MKHLIELLNVSSDDFLETLDKDISENYKSFTLKKNSGKLRWIDAPQGKLKEIQRNILDNILYTFQAHPSAVGFISKKSAKTGAEKHVNAKVLLCIDLYDFFGSIKTPQIIKLWSHLLKRLKSRDMLDCDYSEELTKYIKWMTQLTSYKGRLPQGAPTSPALANLYSYNMDMELAQYSRLNGLIYTRYADDLSFSSDDSDTDMAIHLKEVEAIISGHNLKLNNKKTRMTRPHRRMKVTGIVVNEKLGVPRYKWRNLRAQLHTMLVNNHNLTDEEYQKIRGYIEWLRTLNQERGDKLYQRLLAVKYATVRRLSKKTNLT